MIRYDHNPAISQWVSTLSKQKVIHRNQHEKVFPGGVTNLPPTPHYFMIINNSNKKGIIILQRRLSNSMSKSHFMDIEITSILSFSEADWSIRKIAERIDYILSDVLSTYTFLRKGERSIVKSTFEQQKEVSSVIVNPMTSTEFMTLKGRPLSTRMISTLMKLSSHISKISTRLQSTPWFIL